MSSVNVHIYPSAFKNESRIEKQAKSINKLNYFESILLIGMGDPIHSRTLSDNISIQLLGYENTPASLVKKLLRFLSWYLAVFKRLKNSDIVLTPIVFLCYHFVFWLKNLLTQS